MSNGGWGSSAEYKHKHTKKISGITISPKISVAQVCESVGFQSFQQSALNTLSDVAIWYIRELGKNASFYTNLAGRTESNVFDIVQGLEDLGSSQVFLGASDISRSLSGSGIVQEIVRYICEATEILFAYLIPGFLVIKDQSQQ